MINFDFSRLIQTLSVDLANALSQADIIIAASNKPIDKPIIIQTVIEDYGKSELVIGIVIRNQQGVWVHHDRIIDLVLNIVLGCIKF